MRKASVIILAVVIFCGYIYFSKPGTVVINEKGKIEGLFNKARALLQRDHFWELQLKMANELFNISTEPQLPSSSEMKALYHKYREDENALNDKMKELYTQEERMANSFRIKADSIERAAKWRLADEKGESLRLKDTEKYKTIISVIEAKLHKAKPPEAKP
jgi:hypothetical protein